jgi:hypothetical protein
MAATAADMSWDIPIGMPVYTADARRLGVVTAADPYGLVVEDGLLVRRSYAVSLRDVVRAEPGALHLALRMDQVLEPHTVS